MKDKLGKLVVKLKSNNYILYGGIVLSLVVVFYLFGSITFSNKNNDVVVDNPIQSSDMGNYAEIDLTNYFKVLEDSLDISIKDGKVIYKFVISPIDKNLNIYNFDAKGKILLKVFYQDGDKELVKTVELPIENFKADDNVFFVENVYSEKNTKFTKLIKLDDVVKYSIKYEYIYADTE